jgi:phenylacetate-CoA ligase
LLFDVVKVVGTMAQGTGLLNSADAYQDFARQIGAFAHMLSLAQWLSAQELETSQLQLAFKLLQHARRTTPFYRDRLDMDLGSPSKVQEKWRDIPILTRSQAIANRLKLISRKPPRDMGPVSEGKTSGSTGLPFLFKKNAAMDIVSTALTERMFAWWSMDGRKSLAQISSHGNAKAGEGLTTYGWHSRHADGIKYLMGMHRDTEVYLQWLTACRAHYLVSYPAILKELARMVLDRGSALRFERLSSFAAVLDQETRDLCRAAFGAEIADTYGTEEVGHIAAQCAQCGNYHISAEAVVVEVLRDDGSPAAPGEIGRVVVTPLYAYATPLIRYALEDMAEVAVVPSACGRAHPTLRRILGRSRNLFRFRDGQSLWPVASGFRLSQFLPLAQFQIVQLDFDRFEVLYVPDSSGRPPDLEGLVHRMRRVLRHEVDVTVRSVERIERTASGKLEECLSLIPTPEAPIVGR